MPKKDKTIKIRIEEAMLNKNLEGDEILCTIIKPMKPISPDPFVKTSEFNARFDKLTLLMTNSFAQLTAQMNTRFDGLEARVAKLETSVDSIDKRLTIVENKLDNVIRLNKLKTV